MTSPRTAERIRQERFSEITTQARKGVDCLCHASAAVAERSYNDVGYEMRRVLEALNRIIELAKDVP